VILKNPDTMTIHTGMKGWCSTMVYPPREGDLTREAIRAMANDVIAHGMDVWFKFTCPSCGFRCTAETKNMLCDTYECFECKETCTPQYFGLLVAVLLRPSPEPIPQSTNGDTA